jgi:hypothetical protein
VAVKVVTDWEADHVLAHSGRGIHHHVDNYLAAHTLSNNYHWDYMPEEFQWALKIGVCARSLMEQESELGRQMLERFHRHDIQRMRRRRRPQS